MDAGETLTDKQMTNSKGRWGMMGFVVRGVVIATAAVALMGEATAQSENPSSPGIAERSGRAQGDNSTAENKLGESLGSWVTLSGTVVNAGAGSFLLDHGNGKINVEVDGASPWYLGGKILKPGDNVQVTGRIDDEFFGSRSIEAGAVYVERLGTHFLADPTDEEMVGRAGLPPDFDSSVVFISGTVTGVTDTTFTIDSGYRSVTIDVTDMADNPLDDEGHLKVEPGDRVVVRAQSTPQFFADRRLDVTTIVELDTGGM